MLLRKAQEKHENLFTVMPTYIVYTPLSLSHTHTHTPSLALYTYISIRLL